MFALSRFLRHTPPLVDRRRAPRFTAGPIPATVNLKARALLVNISRAGALLQMELPWQLHAQVTLRVELADRIVDFRGEVVRCATAADRDRARGLRHLVGIQFSEPLGLPTQSAGGAGHCDPMRRRGRDTRMPSE